MSVRVSAWRDEFRRYVHTASGTITVNPGETCIVIVGRTFDVGVLKALGVEMVTVGTSKGVLVEEVE